MRPVRIAKGILLAAVCSAFAQTNPMPTAQQAELVRKYCTGCHNDRTRSGGFSWSKLDLARPERNAAEVEKVIIKLQAGMMPPAGMPRPDTATVRAFVSGLGTAIDRAWSANPNPGRVPLHRLNRTEYRNSVRDLLGVDIDVSSLLPPDDISDGFDNMADVLTFSPTLMDAYIRAAGKISREALGDPNATAAMVTYKVPKIVSQLRHVDGTPFGTRGGLAVLHTFPADGEYIFRMTFQYSNLGVFFGQLQKDESIEIAINGDRVALLKINPRMKLDEDLRTPPIKVKAGPQMISAAFLKHFDGPVEDEVMPFEQSLVDTSNANVPGLTSLPHLRDLSISGPFNSTGVSDTPSRNKLLVCRPAAANQEVACAKKIVAKLARQAYRRPITDQDLEELLGFYQQGRNQADFDAGIRTAVQAILANPSFIFRFERTPQQMEPEATYRISDLELASRLSYFLWSSTPDDELITLASQGKLSTSGVLEHEVRRMLVDPRSEMLATNFASQWLNLPNLKDVQPDPFLYPNFDENLRRSMLRETELFFYSIVREDRNILDLLTADYTFVDERLAIHYGIPNILGSRFRRVQIADDRRRGLLGQASVLTLTSLANRTSPVTRGKWVMSVLMGTPPPTPPPNVPALKENGSDGSKLSVRARMEEHRANPVCAACHKMMDPIGFALDNFDAIGVWREYDSGFRVDASGQMFDGSKLDGPASLREAVLKHSDAFLTAFTKNLLAYGLGRVLEPYDMATVRSVLRDSSRNQYRFSSLVLDIVRSLPFQARKAEEHEANGSDVAAVRPRAVRATDGASQ
jgi:hypothetical protein